MIKRILVAFLVLVIAIGGYLYTRLDSLVKRAVETYGPRITQTSVRLRGVHLSPFSGEGKLKGLVIGSPAGFKEPEVLSLGTAKMAVEPKSLITDVIVVRELSFEAPELHYERQASGANLDALQRNIESSVPASAEPAPVGKQPSKPKKIRIDHFAARGGKVFVNLYGAKVTVPLPDVVLDGIGKPNGVEPKDAAKAVLSALTRAAVSAVQSSGIGRNVQKGVEGVKKQLKGIKGLFR